MSNSASPSGLSQAHTPTGRPSLWSESDQRKLARLYVYTMLPINKILHVIQSSSETGPGKDSANKKLNAMLDKEPRWLHPRTRTDMNRRMQELERSPVRQNPPENAFSPDRARSSAASYRSANRDAYDENPSRAMPQVPTIDTSTPVLAGMEWDPTPVSAGAQFTPVAPSSGMDLDMTYHAAQGPQQPAYQQPAYQQQFHFPLPSRRRSTMMTNGTDTTVATLRRALSDYSDGFLRNVKKVMKRYTMPAHTEMESTPIPERPETADSTRGSWLYDENAPSMKLSAGYLPGDFLSLDGLLVLQGVCVEGLHEHDTRACLCRVQEAAATPSQHPPLWVGPAGPIPDLSLVLQHPVTNDAFLREKDPFGNTILHLLAARDAPQELLFHAITRAAATILNAKNNAGQTFLHVLGPAWFQNVVVPGAPLPRLLYDLRCRAGFDLYARDIYGRTFFHILQAHVQDPTTMALALQGHEDSRYGCRDAFGLSPTAASHDGGLITPIRRAHTSVMTEQPAEPTGGTPMALAMSTAQTQTQSPQLHVPSNNPAITRQAQLLQMVRRAQSNPLLEDEQGRNGLQCLAAAILSPDTLLQKYGGPAATPSGDPGSGRKRKRGDSAAGPSGAPATLKKGESLDSSRERLTLRENIVRNLLDAGVDPNHYDQDGNTVLMSFVAQLPEDDDYKVPVSILQLLIDRGANIHARNRLGETALHVAVRRGRKLAMRTLVQAGANVHSRDGDGRSVLDIADLKIPRARDEKTYAHYEACRAWLSGQGRAVQSPSVLQEWGFCPAWPTTTRAW